MPSRQFLGQISHGKQHDHQCQSEKDGRDSAGFEATADQLVKFARDKSADIMKVAPTAADIDKDFFLGRSRVSCDIGPKPPSPQFHVAAGPVHKRKSVPP